MTVFERRSSHGEELLSQEAIRNLCEILLELLRKVLPPTLPFRQPLWIKVVAQKAFPAQAVEDLACQKKLKRS